MISSSMKLDKGHGSKEEHMFEEFMAGIGAIHEDRILLEHLIDSIKVA